MNKKNIYPDFYNISIKNQSYSNNLNTIFLFSTLKFYDKKNDISIRVDMESIFSEIKKSFSFDININVYKGLKFKENKKIDFKYILDFDNNNKFISNFINKTIEEFFKVNNQLNLLFALYKEKTVLKSSLFAYFVLNNKYLNNSFIKEKIMSR